MLASAHVNDAEQFDSGWKVAKPSTLATGATDPRQQIILHHVLEQTRTPLLRHVPTETPLATETTRGARRPSSAGVASPAT